MTQFAPFGGLDERTNSLLKPPNSSPDLRNVKLHPLGSVGKREGFAVWESPTVTGIDPPASIDGLAMLEKVTDGRRVMLAMAPDRIYRTVMGGTITWEEAATYASSEAGLAHITTVGRFVDDSNTATPLDRSACLYIADGERVPTVERGLATASGSLTSMPAGEYGDSVGTLYSGTHGYPSSVSGGDEVGEWDNNPPSGLFLRGEGRQERMYAWGFEDDPNRVDVSELGVPWNFLRTLIDNDTLIDSPADGGYFYCLADDGDFITGVVDLYDLLIVTKNDKTIIHTGLFGSESDPLQIRQVLPVGFGGYRSTVRVGRDLYGWSPEFGPTNLRGIQEYGDIELNHFGSLIKDSVALVDKQQLDKIVAYHDQDNYRVVWLAPTAGSSTNNIGFCYYYDQPRWAVWDGDYTSHGCVTVGAEQAGLGDVVYAGDYGNNVETDGDPHGSISTLNTGALDNPLAEEPSISAYYVTEWTDLGDATVRKRLQYLDLMIGRDGAPNLDIYIGWDHASYFTAVDELAKTFGSPGSYWGSARFGVDRWGGVDQYMKRMYIDGSGNFTRMKFESSDRRTFDLVGWKPVIRQRGIR